MKPTQEQVIAWAKAVGMERCDCEPRCHLHTGGMGSLTALVDLAYEAGRKDENEACEKLHEEMWASSVSADSTVEAFNGALKGYARAIRARREQWLTMTC